MKFWEIKNAKNEEAEIDVYGDIGDVGFFGESVSARDFRKEVKALGKLRKLTVHINSMGGSMWDGISMHNTLKQTGYKVVTWVDGMAASAASIVAMGGSEVVMADGAELMIHNPWTIAMGDAAEFRKYADHLDKAKSELVSIYAKKSGQSEEHISDLMDAESFFNADEAVEIGLADLVQGDVLPIAASANQSLYEQRYKNLPVAYTRVAQVRAKLDKILGKAS